MNFLKIIGKIILVLIITVIGAGITCGGNLMLIDTGWRMSDNTWIGIWIGEVFISFFIGLYYVFLREEDIPENIPKSKQNKHTSEKDKDIETKDTELEKMSNF